MSNSETGPMLRIKMFVLTTVGTSVYKMEQIDLCLFELSRSN